ncbi:MAG: prepilin-type N-terminal cleavage/methylation domain-containing protein [Rickettsiales bacterium]|nr:prepilin-type N-terminal cleavage/methylation domain-containing protein [Rickettsiales bacterium]
MKKTFSSKKSAFSLIELSIVLIIIGLLIAGVTGGASLIKNSELRAAISEARGYQVAVNGFFSQFNSLPGDYPRQIGTSQSAGPTTGNGDNSRIEYFAADEVGGGNSESVAAWSQLIQSGTIDPNIVLTYSDVANAQSPGVNMPSSKIKSSGWHFDYRNGVGVAGDYTNTTNTEAGIVSFQNVVVLTGSTTAVTDTASTLVNGTTNAASASLFGTDAVSIDTKVDDGKANTGKVRGLNPGNTTGCYTAAGSAADYIITTTTSKVCALTFKVDPKG